MTAPRVRLLGFEVDAVTMDGAIEHVARAIARGEGGWTLTPNLDILRQITHDREFGSLAAQTTLRLVDGMPLVWASRLLRTPVPGRVAGSDLLVPLCQRAAREGWAVFLLGGNPGAAEGAAAVLRERAPGLRLVGLDCPPMGFEKDPDYLRGLEARLKAAAPLLVFVALGSPKQERLIADLRGVLPLAWFFGIGVTFSFVSGEIQRAPGWARASGLEWAHRLIQEPRRLAGRYLLRGVPFAIRLLVTSFFQGLRSSRRASVDESPR